MDDRVRLDDDGFIEVKGARVNNLKNIDVMIPRDTFTVVTGLSGSGKSSLAFDTLYAEGQRRYVESLSSYARQFLGRMNKPECDYIKGIPPAIALEQKVSVRNPRSTVGTSTEIYEYMRLLFARVGKTISPVSGQEVKKHNTSDVVKKALSYPEGTKFAVYAPVIPAKNRSVKEHLAILMKEGYTRVETEGKMLRLEEILMRPENKIPDANEIELVIDRLAVSDDKLLANRLADSVETAFFEGHGICRLKVEISGEKTFEFSKNFEADGITFEEPSDMMFNFNNPIGACSKCQGFGTVNGIDENLVIPDKSLSVYEGCVLCWQSETMREWQDKFMFYARNYNFPIHRPYFDLTEEEKDLLWHGYKEVEGIDDFFEYVDKWLFKIQFRVLMARYKGKTVCPECYGSRLKQTASYVRVGGKNIGELVTMPVKELKKFFDNLQLTDNETKTSKRLLTEINNRLQFMLDVGLGYLTLDRLSASLSGGESQRISIIKSLGNSLTGSMYVLDEPSIGLHPRDTSLLLKVLRQLKEAGNTVVVVEHDEEIIRAADHIIDIGPAAGRLGGEVIYEGEIASLNPDSDSFTVKYLTGKERIERPPYSRKWNEYIQITEARKNNLKKIDVKFPLHAFTVVTGVSGSGKSTLVKDILYTGVKRMLDDAPHSVECKSITGDVKRIHAIEFVDQHSIGTSSRSNPVTYIGAYDEIRVLYGDLPLSHQMEYTASHFSFNKEGGRCEECKGEGRVTVEMQFMADITLECEACHGKRFKQEILEVEYHGFNISDILEMTVDQAMELFEQYAETDSQAKKIARKMKPLQDVGLGYIKLGQTSSTLSGGENQRVKLAYYLSRENTEKMYFIFDEPTTGLHFHDIKTLLKAFNALIERGHTITVIEHHPDVIKCADYVIDLGPEGGDAGGYLVCCGTPKEIASCKESFTGQYLVES
ncbi:MAG: excinuclease ABC subunit UvrA [Tannerella sp.]|jgi:excinuclease ABC subunit A|nr:excinuclease ABC subunit UvrA [Tannerella sp.]